MDSIKESYIQVQPLGGFDKPLTYRFKPTVYNNIRLGSLVLIPLGKRKINGIVWSFEEDIPKSEFKVHAILSVIQREPVLTPELMQLASWISQYYVCAMETCLEAMIPVPVREGMKAKSRKYLSLKKNELKKTKIPSRATSQHKVINFLEKQGQSVALSELLQKTSSSATTIKTLIQKGFILETEEKVERVAYEDDFLDSADHVITKIELTKEQEAAVSEISQDLKEKSFITRLLSGVTGSGKTEVYFEAMEMALAQGGGVLFLVPEVALAPQTVSRLRMRFGTEKIVVWHSHLSGGERLDAWRSLIQNESRIVVGARSAVFAPISKLRLIIVDEEHEMSYKQEDNPRYHARDVAVVRAKTRGALCLLGSATPSLESMNNVQKGKYFISKLTQRVDNRELPLVHLIDMRREAEKIKTLPILSQPLIEALRERCVNGEQSILFLNRRGFNTTMLCPDCGHVEGCKHCSIALTYHRTDGYLKCHLCGYRKPTPKRCSECQSFDLQKKGHGTQKIEDLVADLLPRPTRIRRLDGDVMSKKNLFRETLSDFRKGKIDVLVGTQMIAKGLDFPKVTLVGVIDADLPLRMEDFRASERAFQMLVQVSGRSGRGNRAGEVFIQTYAPHSPSIQYARRADLDGFIEEELAMRKEFNYPPYRHLIRHLFRSRSEAKVEFYITKWTSLVKKRNFKEITVKGSAAAPIEKMNGYYRHHLFYFTHSVRNALEKLEALREKFPMDTEVHDVLDVDAHQIS